MHQLSLLLHRAFWNLFNLHTPTNAPVYYLRSLKFTLKHLKLSYMFRSYDHPQGAHKCLVRRAYDTHTDTRHAATSPKLI